MDEELPPIVKSFDGFGGALLPQGPTMPSFKFIEVAMQAIRIAENFKALQQESLVPLDLFAGSAALAKSFRTNWIAPDLSFAKGLVADMDGLLGQTRMLHLDWMKSVPNPAGFSALGIQAFGGLGMMETWGKGLVGLDLDLLKQRSFVPYNWPEDFERYLLAIEKILNEEGLPLAWVPRHSILMKLLEAKSVERRLKILRKNRDAVLEDCAEILDELDYEFLIAQIPLARDVVAACKDGHWTAGAALAVMVTHAIVERLEWATSPASVKAHYRFSMKLTLDEMITGATQASLVSFYEEWHPKSKKPEPKFLTRHLVSHSVSDTHLNEHNCLVAVMLMTSLMETVHQLELGQVDQVDAA